MLGIMGALPEEVHGLRERLRASGCREMAAGGRVFHCGQLEGVDVVLTFSRWGKVAAAATVTHLIVEHKVDAVLFTGVAGGLAPEVSVGDIVVADSLVQHDMDARPLFGRFEIPLTGRSECVPDAALSGALLRAAQECAGSLPRAAAGGRGPRVVRGQVATGDRFVSSAEDVRALRGALPSALCVEMEGAAVAQVCGEYGVPFAVMRTISDDAREGAAVDFAWFVRNVASRYSLEVVVGFLRSFARSGGNDAPRPRRLGGQVA